MACGSQIPSDDVVLISTLGVHSAVSAISTRTTRRLAMATPFTVSATPTPLSTTSKRRHHFASRLVTPAPVFSSSSLSLPSSALRIVSPDRGRRYRCMPISAASFEADAGGGGGGTSGKTSGGGGGGDGSGGGDSQSEVRAKTAEEFSALSSGAVILNVEGMKCGGCASSVKKILESQPQVSSASVDLASATANVWPLSDATTVPNWHQQLGEALAKHLTSCGFKSSLRG